MEKGAMAKMVVQHADLCALTARHVKDLASAPNAMEVVMHIDIVAAKSVAFGRLAGAGTP
jgi:hypothetical protein